ncbi:uncharacterized protein ALTATR162_LOCUS11972 [Alternaria atra]|uniref:Uncharacterized protein n=1 Tax=Alternaria atra TaxID=119953 RepID=A0A8J2IC01_9PLEO|nr:uncharacterized protein ALTATR162_LOCUS11972 [Alternaria atra]CAG5188512.1 unnamed protein product [Alternaria atra]
MLPRLKQLCREIIEAYKPWVKDEGIQDLFLDAYIRVGLRLCLRSRDGLYATESGRLTAVTKARRNQKYDDKGNSVPNMKR